jgi:hypothetical protein
MKTMKKFFTLSLILGLTISTFGQTDGGKIFLGGTTNLTADLSTSKWKSDDNSGTNSKTTSIDFEPHVGIFVVKNLAIGLSLDVYYSLYKNSSSEDKSSQTLLEGTPFLRFYIGNGKVKPFVQGKVGGGLEYYKDMPVDGTSTTSKYTVFNFGFMGGVALFLNDHVSLDLGLGFNSNSSKAKENNDNNYRNIDHTIGFNIGIVTVL